MLEEVRITGLGVIDDAVLEPSPGLTVVTGETGAGKTMVVTGLGLLFGGRGDPARVRPGCDRATVEGRLRRTRPGYEDYVRRTSAFVPLPPKRAESPSRNSHASCSPVLAPLGTAARPTAPPESSTSTSTVGFPRESRISRA